MRPNTLCLTCVALVSVLIGCNKSDQQRLDEKAAEAREKTRAGTERLRQDAHQLGREAKQEAHTLRQNIGQALSSTGPAQDGSTTRGAEEKLRRGGEDLRVAGNQAAVKLDHAALIAKIKAQLATHVGLSTVTGVDVDAGGQIVTLRGTVASEDQKRQAEEAALQVAGVSRVVNQLRVQP
ncbi:MAG: BON domain-containing protein [Acidobacteriaceae bacterium]|nr:BON domain-containing protein [Acidobacteriaceae bacterium]